MNIFFITLSTITFLFLLSGSLYYFKHNNRFIREKAVTISAVFMTIYSVYCILLALYVPVQTKLILIICGFSPFIIGHFATYKRLFFYTIVQLLVIAIGIVYTVVTITKVTV